MHRIEKKTEKRMKENCGKIENILNLALDATREELGDLSGRFNYEFVCDLNKRIPRVYVKQK